MNTKLLKIGTAIAITLASTAALAADEHRKIEAVASFPDAMLTGVTVSANGRIFVNYPRWGDDVPFTVAEVVNGKAVAYPDAAINKADPSNPGKSLISVQSVVVDAENRLWILDTAAPGFKPPLAEGPKMIAVDLETNKIVKTIVFPKDVILTSTYVNDVRFDLTQGSEGVAYITDSSLTGPGAIIVVDLATGTATRRLSGDKTTAPDPEFTAEIDDQKLLNRPQGGQTSLVKIASDGIAISADGATLYFSPLSSRHLYSVPTASLRDATLPEDKLAAQVVDLGLKGASDGLESDDKGRVYGGDYEHHSIRMLENGKWSTIAQSKEIQWPDTLSVASDGYLYFTANQLNRQAGFHNGKDLRVKPYKLFRIKIDGGPVLLKKGQRS
ncbi:gluconolaconase [Neorhizobium sp. LMR1-1-1.1]